MRAGKKMTTLRRKASKSVHHEHLGPVHPPKHKTMACVRKMAVKKSAS